MLEDNFKEISHYITIEKIAEAHDIPAVKIESTIEQSDFLKEGSEHLHAGEDWYLSERGYLLILTLFDEENVSREMYDELYEDIEYRFQLMKDELISDKEEKPVVG